MRPRPSTEHARHAPLLMLCLALAGCATTTDIAATDAHRSATLVACEAFRPISWSVYDTDPTISEVKGHNAAWKATCE